jgi:hypothetical protein
MTPEELILQLKKKGTFDELRKQALQEFQANVNTIKTDRTTRTSRPKTKLSSF